MTRRLLDAPKKSEMFIYGLFDPRTKEVRYVGQTAKGLKRAWQHWGTHAWKTGKNLHKKAWIGQLKTLELKYEVEILERCNSYEALDEAETFWIKHLLEIDVKLVNKSLGGAGERPIHGRTDEQRIHCSKANGGRPIQDELGNVYLSKLEAERKLHVAHQTITRVLKGKDRHAGGHTFSYVGEELPEPFIAKGSRGPYSEERKINAVRGKGCLPFKDQYGKVYQTATEAAKDLNCRSSLIIRVLKKKRKSVRGFSFIYINETEFQDLSKRKQRPSGLVYNLKPNINRKNNRKIIDQNGKIYASPTIASKETGISLGSISRVLSGIAKTTKGYSFSYLNNNLIVDIGDS